MSAKTRIYIFLVITIANGPVFKTATAQSTIPAGIDSAVTYGTRLTIEQKYAQATDVFLQLQQQHPDHPAGYFFQAALLQTQMMDFEKYDRIEKFNTLIQETIERAKKRLNSNSEDAWAHFYLGGALGYRAFYHGKQKRYFEALQHSRRSVEALKMAIRSDSTLYDAYFGIGTYLYYRSRLSRYLTWLPFVEDEREKGMQMIRTTIEKGRYARYSAMNMYGWICIDEGRYKEGFQVIKQALAEFPESRVFLWCAAKLSVKLERWPRALHYYTRILDSLQNPDLLSPYNEVSCRKQMIEVYLELDEPEKARKECRKLNNLRLNRADRKLIGDKLDAAQALCSKHSIGAERDKSD